MKKIIVIGSSNTDMVIKSKRFPLPGETLIGGQFFMNHGGKGANQAVAAARLGGQVSLVAKLGEDIFGEQAMLQFTSEGIETSYITTDPQTPSGIAMINVDEKGENCIVVSPGANDKLTPADIDAAIDKIEKDDVVLLQLETPLETIAYAVKEAKSRGAKVILNPAPAKKLPDSIFSQLDIITPNETEAALLTGISVEDHESTLSAAKMLYKWGVRNVIITLGSKGAFLYNASTAEYISSVKVEATDTTAAGDCFNGGLAVALAEQRTLGEAVSLGCQAAAIAVTRMGAQSAMPFRKELNH